MRRNGPEADRMLYRKRFPTTRFRIKSFFLNVYTFIAYSQHISETFRLHSLFLFSVQFLVGRNQRQPEQQTHNDRCPGTGCKSGQQRPSTLGTLTNAYRIAVVVGRPPHGRPHISAIISETSVNKKKVNSRSCQVNRQHKYGRENEDLTSNIAQLAECVH
jgi:hypothetical protein